MTRLTNTALRVRTIFVNVDSAFPGSRHGFVTPKSFVSSTPVSQAQKAPAALTLYPHAVPKTSLKTTVAAEAHLRLYGQFQGTMRTRTYLL